jgi:hypothetical protein
LAGQLLVGGKKEEAAVLREGEGLQQLVVALLTGDLLVQGQAAAPTAVVQVETLLVLQKMIQLLTFQL